MNLVRPFKHDRVATTTGDFRLLNERTSFRTGMIGYMLFYEFVLY